LACGHNDLRVMLLNLVYVYVCLCALFTPVSTILLRPQ